MRTTNLRIALVIGALFVAAGCDERGSPTGGSPTAGSPAAGSPAVVAPDGAFTLTGAVSSFAGSALAGARVEAVSRAGTFNVVTDRDGVFAAFAAGETVVKVEMEGFHSLAKTLTVNGDETVFFRLVRSDAGGSTGEYTLTFRASDTCSLPPDAMRRVYEVGVEEVQQALLVSPRVWEPFVGFAGVVGFTGTRDGDAVTFRISDCLGFSADDVCFVERIPGVGDVGFAGTATGTITGPTITAAFSGTLSIIDGTGAPNTLCQAGDHRMEFVRTGAS